MGITGLGFAAQVKPLLTPKAAEQKASLGKPMITQADMMPSMAPFVVLPPAMTNMPVRMTWSAAPMATCYHAFIGTNDGVWLWSAVTTNLSVNWTVRVPDNTEFFYGTVYSANEMGASKKPYIVRVPDFDFNFDRVNWFPPVQVLLAESSDFRIWNVYYARPPVTNAITAGKNKFYFAMSPGPSRVVLDIKLLREWNASENHYGGSSRSVIP